MKGECKCVTAEEPLCGDLCFHFYTGTPRKAGRCTNCNNTGLQMDARTMAELNRARDEAMKEVK